MQGDGERILYLATGVFDKGGISRYSRYQIRALRELLDEESIRVLSLWGPGNNDFEQQLAVDYAGRGASLAGKSNFSFRATWELVTWKPTVILANHIHLLPLAIALSKIRPQVNTFLNVYGLELWSGRERLCRRYLPKATHVISDCHFSKAYILEKYGVQPQKTTVIWDCVDINRFRPEPRRKGLLEHYGLPTGKDKRYLMTLGRLGFGAMHKGYDRLLDAMSHWQLDPSLICLIAGDGDQRGRLEHRVQTEGLTQNVYFLGSIPEDELVSVYNLCHVFTLVSERGPGKGEGLPLTPLEAAACGKPIIVGDEDGSHEAVRDGYNGYVVSPRDPAQYLSRTRALLTDDELRKRMGQAARSHVENHFSFEQFGKKTERLIEKVRKGGNDS